MMDLSAFGIPTRGGKPRQRGLTMVIDTGHGLAELKDLLETAGSFIDGVKFGWGSGFIHPMMKEKIAVLREYSIPFWFGGTAFEVAYKNDRLDAFLDFIRSFDTKLIEISDGVVDIDDEDKLQLISDLSKEFDVYSEVGSKDAEEVMSPKRWISAIKAELEAGAVRVIAEGRESGTAGIYRNTGEVRMGLIDELSESGIDMNNLILEAPTKTQQVWFIGHLGRDVNLGNIKLSDAINVETLRLGLRADTVHLND